MCGACGRSAGSAASPPSSCRIPARPRPPSSSTGRFNACRHSASRAHLHTIWAVNAGSGPGSPPGVAHLLALLLFLLLVVDALEEELLCQRRLLGVAVDHDGGHVHVAAVVSARQRRNLARQLELGARAEGALQLFRLLLHLRAAVQHHQLERGCRTATLTGRRRPAAVLSRTTPGRAGAAAHMRPGLPRAVRCAGMAQRVGKLPRTRARPDREPRAARAPGCASWCGAGSA